MGSNKKSSVGACKSYCMNFDSFKIVEKEANCVFALFSSFLKIRLVNLFSHDMSFCTLFSFDDLIYCT